MTLWRRLLLILAVVLAAPAFGQSIMERLITPGPLSAGHARLESTCDSCHSSFRKEAQNGKCLACHKGIAADIATASHYHGKFAPARGTCKGCHSEHKGRGAGLIRFNRIGFNHAFTDFALTGGHARVDCAGCHGTVHNYRGIPKDCASCHAGKDPHRGQLGRSCQSCHTTAAWKPVQGFNHAATGFALTGRHRSASCLSCHAGQRWKGLPTGCVACHAKDDAHHGSRGSNCAQCHSTAGWKQATFDHATTGFPLIGGHAEATCSGCHGAGNATKHPSRSCFACHARDDVHKGQNGTDCASCHNPRSWKQTSFDHDRMTDFPLRGVHRTTKCEACHAQPPKVASPPVTCFGCHARDDAHKGANGMDCARCHTAASWKSATFNHDTMTSFPLAGAHAKTKCEDCHGTTGLRSATAVKCASCHAKDDVHAGHLGKDCARCHNSTSWKAQVRFDHDLTRFPLLGKHADQPCKVCHADRSFASKGTACQDCHADKHHAGTLGTPAQCRTCHTPADWTAWHFDHDQATAFPLTGKHQGLICSACHARPGDPARLGTRCVDCHRRSDPHRGGFGDDCERCHVTSGFREILMKRTAPGRSSP